MPPPTTTTRPRSAMARSGSIRSGLTTPVEDKFVPTDAPPVPTLRTAKPHTSQPQPQGDSETHIQVAIRCRRRSEREVQENSPIIVSSEGARSQAITIETAAPVSSLGIVTLPPTRTYPFDLVFGPEADQVMIYQDVVSPMLDEVLLGYNCTLFAYGQTGTGKTYTMQGDLGTTPLGNPTAQAGMIPRVLFRLFHQLESSGSDYSVRISYVELYNEELRDLLAPELAAPSGSTQPMGMGGNSREQNANQGGLRIFDDASKKGVFIQGLEEMPVKDAQDALALLVKGSHRRQIAATKFNDHSSRSHSVFSITVHTKETSNMGDDLLRVGKMNLVDLAGSENIGRSGAENKRAREAGMINQSLLTLGRVINALVERSSHIPYRESKLTRLLQDSLGGRTKTCIIATVSPARSNMEETLSTLEYAIRAKSIRNRPEVNQRLTRNALLKEYIAEIERLKADVLAAREKNGIFFSEDTWNQMTVEQELARTEREEAKRQVEIVESQLKSVRDEFEESMKLLMTRDGELKETREKLTETEDVLVYKEGELKVVKEALEEEVVVRKAYQENEATLDEVARNLKATTEESLRDLELLFGKLSRKTAVLNSNTKVVLTHGKTLSTETRSFSAQLDEFIKSSGQNVDKLRTGAEEFQNKELDALATHSEHITEQIQRVQDSLQLIQAKDEASSLAITDLQAAVNAAHTSIRTGFMSWSETLKSASSTTCVEVEKASINSYHTVEKMVRSTGSLVEAIIQEAQQHIEAERKTILEAKAVADQATNEEIRRLQDQNVYLVRLLQNEKAKSDRAKDDLIKRISGLLGDFVTDRDRSLREAITDVKESNEKAEGSLAHLADEHLQRVETSVTRGQEWSMNLDKKGGENKRLRDGALKTLSAAKSAAKDGLANVQSTVEASLTSYTTEIQQQTHTMSTTCADAFERHSRAKRARVEATNALGVEVQTGSRQTQRLIASTSRNIKASTSQIAAESSKFAQSAAVYHSNATAQMSTMRRTGHQLMEQGAQVDSPTGRTPEKRVRQYVDHWELTGGRDGILKKWKQRGRRPELALNVIPKKEEPEDTAHHLLLAMETAATDSAQISEGDFVSTPTEDIEPDGLVSPPSDPATSLPSSASSTSTVACEPPIMKGKTMSMKSGLPTRGLLTERSTNVLFNRAAARMQVALSTEQTDQEAPSTFLYLVPETKMTAGLKTVILLSFVLAVGFLMIILSCALYSNWLPLLVALTFVVAPLPNAVFSHCGRDDFATDYEGSGPVDLGRFITAIIVVTGFALPLVLAHSEVIKPGASAMSIVGGGYANTCTPA
ncbi:hypothetical protein EWM64_g1392 [Hericium alpestre]|uniref:Kinesin motor domain-containing protein n=1 Tax=Hericium alpestre TaxID=135208 RepID=A0A4Z0A6F6_9AGAM|nr:hypothetical protein EWM64_g1392 [Hericium alpestre]